MSLNRDKPYPQPINEDTVNSQYGGCGGCSKNTTSLNNLKIIDSLFSQPQLLMAKFLLTGHPPR